MFWPKSTNLSPMNDSTKRKIDFWTLFGPSFGWNQGIPPIFGPEPENRWKLTIFKKTHTFSIKSILFQKIDQNMKMNNLSMSKTRRTLTLATFVCCECSMYKIKFGWDTFDNENLFCDETTRTMKIYFVMRHIRQMKFYFLMVSHPLSLFNFDFSSVIHHNEILQVTILFSHGISSTFYILWVSRQTFL